MERDGERDRERARETTKDQYEVIERALDEKLTWKDKVKDRKQVKDRQFISKIQSIAEGDREREGHPQTSCLLYLCFHLPA